MNRDTKKLSAQYWLVFAAIMIGWTTLAFWLVPAVIRQAYRGESLGVLNGMIAGQGRFPVEHYLGLWTPLARMGTAAILALGLAVYLLLLVRAPVLAAARRSLDAWLGEGRALVSPFAVVTWAIALGLLTGFGELLYVLSRVWLGTAEPGMYHRPMLWMTPLATAMVFAIAGLVLAAVVRFAPRAGSLGFLVTLFGATGVFALLRVTLGGVHWVAALVLAVGVALRVSASLARRPVAATRWAGRLMLAGLVLVSVAAVSVEGGRRRAERRALDALPAPPADGPNVLLLLLDTVRAQNLSLYGYERETTPEFERLAARGAVFERAIATSSWSLPGHASIFTGHYPHELSADWDSPLDDHQHTLAEALTERGYATGGFVANRYFGGRYWGLHRGFVHYDNREVSVPIVVRSAWLGRAALAPLLPLFGFGGKWTAEEINREFLGWLNRIEGRPFFGFVNYMDAHAPYNPPRGFLHRFTLDWTRTRLSDPGYEYTEDELQQLVDAYDGAIAYLDWSIGQLIDELGAVGKLDNTLVIVTSDHGEAFGEHDNRHVEHGHSLYLPEIAVPLIVFGAGVPEGIRVPEPVSVRDIPTTVLDLLGHKGESALPGCTLARFWLQQGPESSASPVLSELNPSVWMTQDWQPVSKGPMRSVIAGELQVIADGDGRTEVYDVARDPWEQRDLARQFEGDRDVERLQRWLKDTSAWGPDDAHVGCIVGPGVLTHD